MGGKRSFLREVGVSKTRFFFLQSYPSSSCAHVDVERSDGLDDDAVSSLIGQLRECATEHQDCGMPALFAIYQVKFRAFSGNRLSSISDLEGIILYP